MLKMGISNFLATKFGYSKRIGFVKPDLELMEGVFAVVILSPVRGFYILILLIM